MRTPWLVKRSAPAASRRLRSAPEIDDTACGPSVTSPWSSPPDQSYAPESVRLLPTRVLPSPWISLRRCTHVPKETVATPPGLRFTCASSPTPGTPCGDQLAGSLKLTWSPFPVQSKLAASVASALAAMLRAAAGPGPPACLSGQALASHAGAPAVDRRDTSSPTSPFEKTVYAGRR